MNLLVENGMLREVELGSNFAYVLEKNESLLSTEYKVLQSQSNSNFIKCMRMLYNGKVALYYMVNDAVSLAKLLPTLDVNTFFTIVGNLFAGIIEVKNNGFLSCNNIDNSLEHIYIDQNTLKIGLVYLPLSIHAFSDAAAFEKELRSQLVRVITGNLSLSSPRTTQLVSDLQNSLLSIEVLQARIGGSNMSGNFTNQTTDTDRPPISAPSGRIGGLKLVVMDPAVRLEIAVTKPEFTIGKKDTNDGVVNFNKAISRVHCKISSSGQQYFVSDLGSANGTYLNGTKLWPNQPAQLKNNDVLRLANSEFRVVMG